MERNERPGKAVTAAPRWRRLALPVVGLAVFAAALVLIHAQLRHLRGAQIRESAASIPASRFVAAVLAGAAAYGLMTGYDALAVRYAGRRVAYRKLAPVSLASLAVSLSAGYAAVSGGAVRYRHYAALGLTFEETIRIIAFCSVAAWSGYALLLGLELATGPVALTQLPSWIAQRSQWGAGVAAAALAALAAWTVVRRKPLRVRTWQFPPVPATLAGAALVVSAAEWCCASLTLYLLLPAHAGLSWPQVLELFLLAHLAGVASQVPGGLGVFEASFLLLAPADVPREAMAGGLLLFRLVYYLLPLLVASVWLAAAEWRSQAQRVPTVVRRAVGWQAVLLPRLFSLLVFAAGALLLVSGSTPALPERLRWVNRLLPLPVMELSHFLASLIGVFLLILTQGLYRRVNAAWGLTLALLMAGAVLSVAKGGDWEEASVLATMAGTMALCRGRFTRHATLLVRAFTPAWWTAVLGIVAGCLWLGLFSYRHVEYRHELWWQVSLQGDAPRSMRAAVGLVVAVVTFLATQVLRSTPRAVRGGVAPEDEATVAALVAACPQSHAALALLGDKQFVFNAERTAFIMYAQQGASRVVMGDPVGDESARRDLLWSFCERCDDDGARAVFYEVSERGLHDYVEMGFAIVKLGEEGRVPLAGFSLDGPLRARWRQTLSRAQRAGCSFEVLEPAAVAAELPRLRAVSDAWLAKHAAAEKRFSLGCFREDYLRRFPVAVVRCGGDVVAFANLWLAGGREEVAPDLMRYGEAAPPGVMDYLFIELMRWGAGQGFRWMNLGMTPLAGLETRRLAPAWNRVAGLLYEHGERAYNFAGLRAYKEKFQPQWQGRYLATRRRRDIAVALLDATVLISGGLRGALPQGRGAARVSHGGSQGSRASNAATAASSGDPANVPERNRS